MGRFARASEMDRELRKAAAAGPDFAGLFAVLPWTCGVKCIEFSIVNIRTGRIYKTPFLGVIGCGGNGDEPLQFRLNSRLLIVKGNFEGRSQGGPCPTHYFVFGSSGLKQIRSIALR